MITVHKPVLVDEVIKFLAPSANANFIDGTLGGGGHTEAILKLTGPKGKVVGFDWDFGAIIKSKERLKDFGERVIYVNKSYTKIREFLSEEYDQTSLPISGILLDLGLSSDQLQLSGRGFTFQANEPLDMRFSVNENQLTAFDIVNGWSVDDLTTIIRDYGEEKFARKIALAIFKERSIEPIKTTLQLANLIYKIYPRFSKQRIHPATKTFQALRIAVNGELENIKDFLQNILPIIPKGCRLAIISFHSLEDRLIKDFFRQESTDCLCPPEIPVCRCSHRAQLKLLTKKPIMATEEEISNNFRARSAKLRVVEKI